jgi:hypothetical protein
MLKEILNATKNFIDTETGLLHIDKKNPKIDKKIPIYYLGNILEWTGQFLIGLSKYSSKKGKKVSEEKIQILFDLILEGLLKNEAIEGLIPRTVSNGYPFPEHMKTIKGFNLKALEKERKRWEKIKKNGGWCFYRTDVSHSQFTFLLMGLVFTKKQKYNLLTKRILQRLQDNNFHIKNIFGKIIKNGVFFPFGNQGLRKLFVINLGENLNINFKVSFVQKIILKSNLIIISKNIFKLKESDSFNTWLLLYALCEINNKYSKFKKEFEKTFKPKLPEQKNIDLVNNFENAIRYLLLKTI